MNKFNVSQAVIDESLRAIGNYLKQARIERGLLQEELAEKMNSTASHLSKCENGKYSYSMGFFLSWCAHLQINPYLIPKEIRTPLIQKIFGLEEKLKGN